MQSWFFSIITPVFSVTWSFRNHFNMLFCCSGYISYYHKCWKRLCKCLSTVISFIENFKITASNLCKNVKLFSSIFDWFNASLIIFLKEYIYIYIYWNKGKSLFIWHENNQISVAEQIHFHFQNLLSKNSIFAIFLYFTKGQNIHQTWFDWFCGLRCESFYKYFY